MNEAEARRLVKETFENPFDKGRFQQFARQLLNHYDEAKAFAPIAGAYVKNPFQNHIASYERIGQYVDGAGNLIDILVVRTHRTSLLSRARTLQRDFIAWYLNRGRGDVQRDAALVAVVAPSEEDWRFSLVWMDYKLEATASGIAGRPDFTPARRYSFLVGANERSHTAQERVIPLVKKEEGQPTLDDLRSAFSVEKVTDDFYKDYKSVFLKVEETISGVTDDKRSFTQRLFNRLLFIRFLEKKKWLRYDGSPDYLESLFAAAKERGQNFYTDRLLPLFFKGLGRLTDETTQDEEEKLIAIRGLVPFLNGGLFEAEDDEDTVPASIPNEAFDLVFNDLFRIYNFTVEEGTPVDVDVAVDPEMLGKIFEELVTGRHDTGAYYTPKPIVAFMCREALKGYLADVLSDESNDGIVAFVDRRDPGSIRDCERALDALRRVKVCDPACGSGAYLLGMLHELIDLRSALLFRKKTDDATLYEKKLEIIRSNLYGVDIDEFAVNIARFRLWLSLVVEDNRNPLENPAIDVSLPNLDLKIEQGDSVAAIQPSTWDSGDVLCYRDIQEFAAMKAEYMRAHGLRKAQFKQTLNEIRTRIVAARGEKINHGFDWQVEFAEVFLPMEAIATIGGAFNFGQELAERPKPGGFDIVLANPPFVRQELLKDQKPALKKTYGNLFCGTADLYVYFYLRALQILRPGGTLVFISSNKWFRANYGEKLREHVSETCAIQSITDFGELPVFEAPATFPMIIVVCKGVSAISPTVFTQVKSLDFPYPDVLALVNASGQSLPSSAFNGACWTLTDAATADMLRKMEKAGMPLGEYVKGAIYRGVLTGFNKAFVIDGAKRAELIAKDPKSAEIIKPLAVGDDIRKWRIERKDRWLIVTPIGIDMKRYPAVFAHLRPWQTQLEKRSDKGEHWWELRACAYYAEFDKPKIVLPDIAKEARFSFDTESMYVANTGYIIPANDLYLLGILNSSPVWSFAKSNFCCLGDPDKGGRFRFIYQSLVNIPIPDASASDRAAIAALARKCLDAYAGDHEDRPYAAGGRRGESCIRPNPCETWEKEIDDRVAALYGLDKGD